MSRHGGLFGGRFCGSGTTAALMEMVLTLYRFMQSHPFPEKWLAEKVAMYFPGPEEQASLSPWERCDRGLCPGNGFPLCGAAVRALEECREDPAVEKAFTPPWRRTAPPSGRWRPWRLVAIGTAFPSGWGPQGRPGQSAQRLQGRPPGGAGKGLPGRGKVRGGGAAKIPFRRPGSLCPGNRPNRPPGGAAWGS